MAYDENLPPHERRDPRQKGYNRQEGRRQDPRRHEPRYEDSQYEDPRQRSRVSYADIDRGNNSHNPRSDARGRGRDAPRNRNYGRDYHDDKRRRTRSPSRSRSRSPYYVGKDVKEKHFAESDDRVVPTGRDHDDRSRHKNAKADQRVQDRYKNNGHQMSGRGKPPYAERQNHGDAPLNGSERKQKSLRFSEDQSRSTALDQTAPTIEATDGPEHEPLDEAAQIEARRLKREAIKARLKSQNASSLREELHMSNDSGPSTPGIDRSGAPTERSVSPAAQSPRTPLTPLRESLPGSPMDFILQNEGDLANNVSVQAMEVDGEFQSAADYDPTSDMQEDRLREAQMHQKNEVFAASFDELKQKPEHVLVPESQSTAIPAAKKSRDDYDMFADDVDDDIFTASSEPRHQGSSKHSIPQGSAKNADLLDNWTDAEGYWRITPGQTLGERYEVKERLGKGVFSNVVRAIDSTNGSVVAVKILRNNETMYKAGVKEIDSLRKLMEADPDDKRHLIRFVSDFMHNGHLCLVFEPLGDNLRDILKQFGRTNGLHLGAVRSYAYQMFLGLTLLKKCNLIHADIKPDNILCHGDGNMSIKICDLGSTIDMSDANEPTSYLASRFYRAPEVMLGCPYNFAIDIWSIGCTLFELYTGKILFAGGTNNQMLRAIMETRGKISIKMLKKGLFSGKHFEDNGDFRSEETDKTTNKPVIRMIQFTKPVKDLRTRVLNAPRTKITGKEKELDLFIDLLDKCLTLNPDKRITPNDALRHLFFTQNRKNL